MFNIKLIKKDFNSNNIQKIRLTVDTENDFKLLSSLYSEVMSFNTENIITEMDCIINNNPK